MHPPMVHITRTLILFLLVFPASKVQAAESATEDIAAYFRVMWGLLIVLAIILVLYALFRKRFSIINPRRSGKSIHVLEIQPLMPRKALCLVEVKGKEYLLGVGNETITLLAALDSEEISFQEALDDSQARRQS